MFYLLKYFSTIKSLFRTVPCLKTTAHKYKWLRSTSHDFNTSEKDNEPKPRVDLISVSTVTIGHHVIMQIERISETFKTVH